VSGAPAEDRLRSAPAGALDATAGGEACTLHVHAVFRDLDAEHVQTLAAEMIARAHELANRPECECDVDVDVQYAASQAQG
jgi:hypothetical protein